MGVVARIRIFEKIFSSFGSCATVLLSSRDFYARSTGKIVSSPRAAAFATHSSCQHMSAANQLLYFVLASSAAPLHHGISQQLSDIPSLRDVSFSPLAFSNS